MDNNEYKRCLTCNKKLVGRLDKLYCDAQCRSSFHNKIMHVDEKGIQLINRALRKNRSILKKLSPNGKAMVRRELVLALGFSFQYFTSIYRNNQSSYYMSYDYGFRALLDNGKQKIQIIQQQAYHVLLDPWTYVKG